MKILFSPFSPYVRKCLVTAHELGMTLTLLPSNAHPVNRDHEIIANNPLGKVPTFFSDDGQVLFDSRVICEYLDHLAGGKLLPAPGRERWAALTLQSLGDGMLDAALLARYETVARPEPHQWMGWRDAQLDKIETSLAALNAHPEWLRDRVNLGSIAIGCALWYLDLRFPELGWAARHPSVAGWYAEYGQRESMRQSWALPA